jgi:PadR family transcriptional regulator PadR
MAAAHRPSDAQLIENLRIELRSGCLVIAVLGELRSEHYGYTLRKRLVDLGIDIEENTLYPMLRRLEAQGLLTSEWREEERRKRFYRLTPQGGRVLAALLKEWDDIHKALQRIRHNEA